MKQLNASKKVLITKKFAYQKKRYFYVILHKRKY